MRFEISGFKELVRKAKVASDDVAEAYRNIIPSFAVQAHATVQNVLLKAAAQAGAEAFPLAYIEPMLEAASQIVITSPAEVAIDFDELGSPDDLQEGFHYGAKIEGGGQVDLPYGGESLKNDTAERYEAWQRIFRGETWHGIDYSGSWSETIAARLEAWGDKAPQWLLLQYGQTEWEPIIFPYPIVEEITSDLTAIFESMLRLEINLIAARFNKP
jgi:hypothetical protein